nr:unnamed protein product [Callosobruchus analis]
MGNLFPTMSKYISESELSSDSESDFNVDNSADTSDSRITALNTADASLQISVSLPDPQVIITLDKVPIIQNHLDEQDMISLVYLLFDQPLYALQEIALWRKEKERQVLYEWASVISGKGNVWKNQLLEALCIIKNYHILKGLGYDKDHLVHFLPHSPYASVYVNKLRKVLYIICEKLDSSKTDTLLDYVRKDCMYKNMKLNEFNMDPIALELYLLDWESSGFVKQTSVENLMKVFKVMEQEDLYNILDSYHKSLQKSPDKQKSRPKLGVSPISKKAVRSQLGLSTEIPVLVGTSEKCASNLFGPFLWDDPDETCQRISNSVDNQQQHVRTDQSLRIYRGLGDPESLETNLFEPTVEEHNRFYIDPKNPGKVLIINQEYFYTETMEEYRHLLPKGSEQLERRTGTEHDKERLANTFRKFGFELKSETNLKHMDMVSCIKQTVASIKNESSLFICILSHGDKGIVYGANSCRVQVSEIQDIMCRPHLVNKPKILILQSCQGFQCFNLNEQKDQQDECVENESLATDGPTNLPYAANLLTFWATVPGYAAIRHKEKGSWFIQSLCEKIEAYQDKIHFLDICTRVRKDVSDKRWIKGAADYRMCSEIQTTFLQDFFLPKMRL